MSDELKQEVVSLRRYIDLMERQSAEWRRMVGQLSVDNATLKAKWQDQDFHHFDRHLKGLSAGLEVRIKEVTQQANMLREMADRLQAFKNIS